jgi:peptidoglycan/LPS O-acetylase OafA/YrhL
MAGADAREHAPPKHLDQIDVVRLLTFLAVIGVHSVDFTQSMSSVGAAAVIMLLQFGREVFFALSGFVLVYSAQHRPQRSGAFLRRRMLLLTVPYVAWSLLYQLYGVLTSERHGVTASRLLLDLVNGGAEYHLYFLLVTMQLYLVFPLLLRFVRRTAARAPLVLSVALAVNGVWLAILQHVAAPSGWGAFFWQRGYELLPTYGAYVLVGCYAAIHLDRLQVFVDRHRRPLLAWAVAAAATGEIVFLVQLRGQAPRVAGAVLQPAMLLVSFAAMVITYVIGSTWAAGRRRGARAMKEASDLSFGVYLAHPLVLDLLLTHGLAAGSSALAAPVAAAFAIGGTIIGSTAIAWVARRSAFSLALTGRPRLRATASSPATVHARVDASVPDAPRPTSPESEEDLMPSYEFSQLAARQSVA